MTTSAKVTISEIDRSTVVSSMEGIYAGIVINSEKGNINEPMLITDENKLIANYGKPNPKLGSTIYSAINYLTQGNKLWVVRAGHEDATYAAATVRAKTANIPTEAIEASDFNDECLIVKPIKGGLTQEQLDQYQFDLYATNKLFKTLDSHLYENIVKTGIGSVQFRVTSFDDLKVGDYIALTDKSLEELNDADSDVGENTPTYQITSLDTKTLTYELAKVKTPVTVKEGDVVYTLVSRKESVDYPAVAAESPIAVAKEAGAKGNDLRVVTNSVAVDTPATHATSAIGEAKVKGVAGNNFVTTITSVTETIPAVKATSSIGTAKTAGADGNNLVVSTSVTTVVTPAVSATSTIGVAKEPGVSGNDISVLITDTVTPATYATSDVGTSKIAGVAGNSVLVSVSSDTSKPVAATSEVGTAIDAGVAGNNIVVTVGNKTEIPAVAATSTVGTAKTIGVVGNTITVSVSENASDENAFDITVLASEDAEPEVFTNIPAGNYDNTAIQSDIVTFNEEVAIAEGEFTFSNGTDSYFTYDVSVTSDTTSESFPSVTGNWNNSTETSAVVEFDESKAIEEGTFTFSGGIDPITTYTIDVSDGSEEGKELFTTTNTTYDFINKEPSAFVTFNEGVTIVEGEHEFSNGVDAFTTYNVTVVKGELTEHLSTTSETFNNTDLASGLVTFDESVLIVDGEYSFSGGADSYSTTTHHVIVKSAIDSSDDSSDEELLEDLILEELDTTSDTYDVESQYVEFLPDLPIVDDQTFTFSGGVDEYDLTTYTIVTSDGTTDLESLSTTSATFDVVSEFINFTPDLEIANGTYQFEGGAEAYTTTTYTVEVFDGESKAETFEVATLEGTVHYDNEVLNSELVRFDEDLYLSDGEFIFAGGSDAHTDEITTYAKEPIEGNPVVVRDATNSTTFLVTNSDYLATEQSLVIGGTAPDGYHVLEELDGVKCTFVSKTVYTENGYFVTVKGDFNASKTLDLFKVIHFETEYRDAFLVTALNPGKWGNSLAIGIAKSDDYDNAFIINVYEKGVQVESFEVTREYALDGFGRQMEMEQKINGNSAYIKVFNNTGYSSEDEDGNTTYPLPLPTDYSLWVRDPEDIFIPTSAALNENLLQGHVEVKLTSVEGLNPGDRIKFILDQTTVDTSVLSAEYKIVSIDSVNNTLILDRKIVETEIDMTYVDYNGDSKTCYVYRFDPNYVDVDDNIDGGVKRYPITKLSSVYPAKPLGSSLSISGITGTLVDCGANLEVGGSTPTDVTQGDMITALKTLHNSERTPIQVFMDGGYSTPAYAQAIYDAVEAQGAAHGFLSTSYASEEAHDYVKSITDYRSSLNLNTSHCSLFSGWVKVFDSYNQLYTWVSPDGFAAAAQSMVTRVYNIFTPAAGFQRGMVNALDVKVKPDEGERDQLVSYQVNPIRYKEGTGLVIWGNETLLTKPSPLQMRSVAMLLIKIKTDVKPILENTLFNLNNERTWSNVEGAINAYMRDEIKAKGGVYDYQVKIKDIITDSDKDNRRMPVFIGIKPTSDIILIPVSLTIFSSGMEISVD